MKNDKKILSAIGFLLIFSMILPVNADIESPRKQMKKGILAEDVICKIGFELVIRTNGLAACVKPETAQRMHNAGMLFMPMGFVKSQNEIKTVPASNMSIVNFYVKDQDLNLAHNGIEVVSTEGLLEYTINGVSIEGPEKMIETGPDTGEFYVKLELPETINGKPLSQDDIVLIKYLDQSDYAGEQRTIAKSVALEKTFAKVQTSGGGTRIGHVFTVMLYEPDANRDSRDEDRIPLSKIEYRGPSGIRTTLANSVFDANRGYLTETGPNTNMFEVQIKIPRQIEGKTVHIGDWYELRYIDRSTPSNTDEKIIFEGRIG